MGFERQAAYNNALKLTTASRHACRRHNGRGRRAASPSATGGRSLTRCYPDPNRQKGSAMTRVTQTLSRSSGFFAGACLGGFAAACVETYFLFGRSSDAMSASGPHRSVNDAGAIHFSMAIVMYGTMTLLGTLFFLVGYLLGSRRRSGRSSLPLAVLLGVVYPFAVALTLVLTEREGAGDVLFDAMIAYVFVAPFLAAWRLGASSPAEPDHGRAQWPDNNEMQRTKHG
jgi:hypothetical protein